MLIEQDNVNFRNQTFHHGNELKKKENSTYTLHNYSHFQKMKKNCNPNPKSRISVLEPAVDNVFNNFTEAIIMYISNP
jgi:hypothetical protein